MATKTATTDDLAALEKRLEARIVESARETQRHFDVVAEQLVHDFSGALTDKLSQHEDRLVALERHTGLRR